MHQLCTASICQQLLMLHPEVIFYSTQVTVRSLLSHMQFLLVKSNMREIPEKLAIQAIEEHGQLFRLMNPWL